VNAGNSACDTESCWVPKRKKHVSDGVATDPVEGMSCRQEFKVNNFYVIIDQLKSALQKLIEAYPCCCRGSLLWLSMTLCLMNISMLLLQDFLALLERAVFRFPTRTSSI